MTYSSKMSVRGNQTKKSQSMQLKISSPDTEFRRGPRDKNNFEEFRNDVEEGRRQREYYEEECYYSRDSRDAESVSQYSTSLSVKSGIRSLPSRMKLSATSLVRKSRNKSHDRNDDDYSTMGMSVRSESSRYQRLRSVLTSPPSVMQKKRNIHRSHQRNMDVKLVPLKPVAEEGSWEKERKHREEQIHFAKIKQREKEWKRRQKQQKKKSAPKIKCDCGDALDSGLESIEACIDCLQDVFDDIPDGAKRKKKITTHRGDHSQVSTHYSSDVDSVASSEIY